MEDFERRPQERTFLDRLHDRPIPTTPHELLAEAEDLRRLVDDGPHHYAVIAEANDFLGRLWRSMRRQGGEVPPEPELSDCNYGDVLVDFLLRGRQRFRAINRAVDDVVRWCKAQPQEPPAADNEPTPPEPQGTKRKCYDRDHTWLRWSEEEKMGPAAIRDRHNRENLREPIGTGNSGREVVKTALKKALAERKAEQKKE